MMATALSSVIMVIIACMLGSFGPLCFKLGADGLSMNLKKLLTNYYLYAGAFFYGMASILFIVALRKGELSVLYPIVATSYIWVSLLSMKFLNEKMNIYKWGGILFIIIGVTLIGIGS